MVAQRCQDSGPASTGWISDNIYPVQTQKKQPSKVNMEPSRDIRLATDPTLQGRVEDAAESMDITVSPEEEEQLLSIPSSGRPDSQPILDCDVDRLLSDVTGCPAAKRQIISRPPDSRTVVGWELERPRSSPRRTARSPICFPEVDPVVKPKTRTADDSSSSRRPDRSSRRTEDSSSRRSARSPRREHRRSTGKQERPGITAASRRKNGSRGIYPAIDAVVRHHLGITGNVIHPRTGGAPNDITLDHHTA